MTESDLTSFDKVLISFLMKKRGKAEIWQYLSESGSALGETAASFRRLRELGFLEQKDDTLILTGKGRQFAIDSQEEFVFSGVKSWRVVPERFRCDMIKPFAPYAPKLSKLDRAFFMIERAKDR